MPEYKPLSLLQTRSYPGYQFYATLKYDARTPKQCMGFAVLTIMDWLRRKIGAENLPEELQTPPPGSFAGFDADRLGSYHFSGGFGLDITSLPEHGIWAARIKEPDVERNDRKAVIGRFFVTEIGLRAGAEQVELGVRIDVLDPIDVTEEVPSAYRPAFIRQLFAAKQLRIRQVEALKYDRAQLINSPAALKRLLALIASGQNYMPVIVLTYAAERWRVTDVVEKLDRRLGLCGTEGSFMSRLRQLDLAPQTLEFGNPVLPYDADYMAYHTFGYARVYVVPEKQFEAFRKKSGRASLQPGDLLWIEPACFGGRWKTVPYDPAEPSGVRESRRNAVIEDAHRYSKHKTVSYGSVVFESAARHMEVEERIRSRLAELRSMDAAAAEQKTEELYRETQELLSLYEEENRQTEAECERLRVENQRSYARISALEAMRERRDASGGEGVFIRIPKTEEFYEDELRDLIISILMDAKRSFCTDGTRAAELLDGVLALNGLTGEGLRLFERLKVILFRNKNITDSDKSDLEAIGFEVTRHSNNHYKLVYKGSPRYAFTLPSTAGDVRSMKNAFSEISRRLSVYK